VNQGTVLVVEDTLASLKLLTDTLSAAGYQVLPANSGELALAAVALKGPQLILLDLRMPGMDGFEVLRRLKARDESRDIPVMILSAVSEREQRIEGLKLGAVDFLNKPFEQEELLVRVSTQMNLSLARARLERQAADLRLANAQLQREMLLRQGVEDALRQAKEAAEEGLEQERRLLALVVSSSEDAIISKRLDGIITSWNHGAEKLFGYTAAEILGQPILTVIPRSVTTRKRGCFPRSDVANRSSTMKPRGLPRMVTCLKFRSRCRRSGTTKVESSAPRRSPATFPSAGGLNRRWPGIVTSWKNGCCRVPPNWRKPATPPKPRTGPRAPSWPT
jgi:DNA-binding response OmpR family regulator